MITYLKNPPVLNLLCINQVRPCDTTILVQLAEAARPGFDSIAARDIVALAVVSVNGSGFGWEEIRLVHMAWHRSPDADLSRSDCRNLRVPLLVSKGSRGPQRQAVPGMARGLHVRDAEPGQAQTG